MSDCVVYLDLKKDYGIGRLIGRGNFSNIHVCTLNQNPKDKYAIKTMQKKVIQSGINMKSMVSRELVDL